MLEVEHPAAKVLVELAQLQDEEVGDGTTSVVIIAAELLKVISWSFRDNISAKYLILPTDITKLKFKTAYCFNQTYNHNRNYLFIAS